MTLRELLKEKGIAYKVVSDALGIHPNNMPRYDDLMKRSVEEVMIISKATNIDISELIGISLPRQSEVPTQRKKVWISRRNILRVCLV